MAKSRKKVKQTKAPEIYLPTMIDCYRGSLVGLAVGDALGTTVQRAKSQHRKPGSSIVGGGPFRLKPGERTDETSMALCLAESLITKGTFDPADQMQCYLKWLMYNDMSVNGGSFDVGLAVRNALRNFEKSGGPYSGETNPFFACNGSIMRLAPVPLFYAANPAEAIEKSGLSSRITHQKPAVIDGCRYLGALIVGAVNGASKEELLGKRYSPVAGYWEQHPLTPQIDEIASGSFKRSGWPEIKGGNQVTESLETALWAFYHSSSFETGCVRGVYLGDDPNTIGAVYGQIAGAFYGYRGIPPMMRRKIVLRQMIESIAERLFELSRSIQC